MTKGLIFLGILLLLPTQVFASKYCDGFKAGYKTGYKQASGRSIDPIAPICPIKPLKEMNDPKDDFEFGYIHGLEKEKSKGK